MLDSTMTRNRLDIPIMLLQTPSVQSRHVGYTLTVPLMRPLPLSRKASQAFPVNVAITTEAKPNRSKCFLTSVYAASRSLACPDIPNYLVLPLNIHAAPMGGVRNATSILASSMQASMYRAHSPYKDQVCRNRAPKQECAFWRRQCTGGSDRAWL
jgi:hypothetical protein